MAKRSDNRTQPALSLGLVDPCIAAKDLLGSSGGTVRLSSPHSCGIRTGAAKDKTEVKTCDTAKTAADTVVGRIKAPAASQPTAGAVKLGDLNPPPSWQEVGAPADPCTVIGWDAFPPEVRNPKVTKPTRRPPEKDSVFKAACRFEGGGRTSRSTRTRPPAR